MPKTTDDQDDLFTLLYVSRIAQRERGQLTATVRGILTVSQHRNARANVTGLLVYNDNFFAQVLEGSADSVEETFGRVSRDPRHTLPSVVLRRAITTRSFANWSMCARQLSADDNVLLDRMSALGMFPLPAARGPSLYDAMVAIGRAHQALFDRQSRDILYLD